jgi:hypothetical protein
MNGIVQKVVILWKILSFKNYNCINNEQKRRLYDTRTRSRSPTVDKGH